MRPYYKGFMLQSFSSVSILIRIHFYDQHPLLCLVFSKFKFTINSIFTTWQAVHFIYTHKMPSCLSGKSPKPSESIRNLIKLPVCFHPFITYIIFASNQAFLPFHKPIPKTDKYLNENNPNSLVLKL